MMQVAAFSGTETSRALTMMTQHPSTSIGEKSIEPFQPPRGKKG
jgi:hypothetical protein